MIEMFWGKSKPYKSLIHHMIDTGVTAKVLLVHANFRPVLDLLLRNSPMQQDDLLGVMSYISALHDIGKCHPSFQKGDPDSPVYDYLYKNDLLMPERVEKGFRHEKYTAMVIQRIFKEKDRASDRTTKTISRILGMHHQGKEGAAYEIWDKTEWWLAQQDAIEEELYSLFKPKRINLGSGAHVDAISMAVLGIVILADWIASGQLFDDINEENDSERYCTQAEKRAIRAVADIGLIPDKSLPSDHGFSGLWPRIPKDAMRPLQSAVETLCKTETPMMTIIEAPMGEGKTEAGIYAAVCMAHSKEKTGIYVALPNAATSNQMYIRVSELLADHGIGRSRLLHSMAWVFDDLMPQNPGCFEDSAVAHSWFAPLRRGLLAQYAVGTVDQAMLAALRVKYGVLRLLGLSKKVLIIDEIHAYDAYMSQIIDRLLQWCHALHIPVVLLSATLPQKRRQSLIAAYGGQTAQSNGYPLITAIDSEGQVVEQIVPDTFIKRNIHIKLLPYLNRWEEVARLAVCKVEKGGCLCIIANTVGDAQEIYREIEKIKEPDTTTVLFHARFIASQRNDIEQRCMRLFGKESRDRPQKAILVATQVVEQSLDLDFDEMISAAAPIDLLLQRAGRIHRHEGRTRPGGMKAPILTVLVPEEGKDYGPTEAIYPPVLLKRTVKWLRPREIVNIPCDIRQMIEDVYTMDSAEKHEITEWAEWQFNENMKKGAALDYVLPPPHPRTFSLAESGGSIFGDDENDAGYLTAKTRLGEPSVRVAFLPEEETIILTDETMRQKDTAKRVMSYSVSIRLKEICKETAAGFDPPVEGRGLLGGMIIYRLKHGRVDVRHDQIAGYRLDSNLGVIIERK